MPVEFEVRMAGAVIAGAVGFAFTVTVTAEEVALVQPFASVIVTV